MSVCVPFNLLNQLNDFHEIGLNVVPLEVTPVLCFCEVGESHLIGQEDSEMMHDKA